MLHLSRSLLLQLGYVLRLHRLELLGHLHILLDAHVLLLLLLECLIVKLHKVLLITPQNLHIAILLRLLIWQVCFPILDALRKLPLLLQVLLLQGVLLLLLVRLLMVVHVLSLL